LAIWARVNENLEPGTFSGVVLSSAAEERKPHAVSLAVVAW